MEIFHRLHVLTDYIPACRQIYFDECTFSHEKKIDFKAEPLMFLDLASRIKCLASRVVFHFGAKIRKGERTLPSSVSILKSVTNGNFLKVVIDTVSSQPSNIFSSGSRRKRKN